MYIFSVTFNKTLDTIFFTWKVLFFHFLLSLLWPTVTVATLKSPPKCPRLSVCSPSQPKSKLSLKSIISLYNICWLRTSQVHPLDLHQPANRHLGHLVYLDLLLFCDWWRLGAKSNCLSNHTISELQEAPGTPIWSSPAPLPPEQECCLVADSSRELSTETQESNASP